MMMISKYIITFLFQPLMFAVIENNLSLMERLVALGCNINKKNKEGYIALHFGNITVKLPSTYK